MRDRSYSIARVIVAAVLVALAAASGFTAGADLSKRSPAVYAWGP